MARRVGIKLRVHKVSGRLFKTIGYALGRDGKPKKRVWYFDPANEAAAIQSAVELTSQWHTLRQSGKRLWDECPDFISKRLVIPPVSIRTVRPITVDDAAAIYLGQIEQRLAAGQVSRSHYVSQKKRLMKALEPLSRMPLSMIGEPQLHAAVLWMAQRPALKRDPSKRVSATFARAALHTLRWFLSWADESESVDWRRPNRFRAIFNAKPMLTSEEQRRDLLDVHEVDHFNIEELMTLWKHASPAQRCWMLLGLNCAFCTAEISDLRVSEVNGIETNVPTIERFRSKTIKTAGKRAFARWHLWPETTKYLQLARAAANPENRWLLSREGRPLSEHNAVGQGWKRLTSYSGTRHLGFKYMRKTAAHIVRVELGHPTETANMLLAHSDGTMMRFYSGRDWDGRLREATERLRTYLLPMMTTQGRDFGASEN